MKIKDYSEKYLLDHVDEYETLEYGNLEDNNFCWYKAMFNGKFSYMDSEANAKEGWINVIITNELRINEYSIPFVTPYLIHENDIPIIARIKLYGKVIIFKVDKFGEFIKKG
jgi:hypothetical protein